MKKLTTEITDIDRVEIDIATAIEKIEQAMDNARRFIYKNNNCGLTSLSNAADIYMPFVKSEVSTLLNNIQVLKVSLADTILENRITSHD